MKYFVEISPDWFQAQLHTNFPDLTAEKKEEQYEHSWQKLYTNPLTAFHITIFVTLLQITI